MLYLRFYEAAGITVGFGNVVYITDNRVGSLKIITEVKQCILRTFWEVFEILQQLFRCRKEETLFVAKFVRSAITSGIKLWRILNKRAVQIIRENAIQLSNGSTSLLSCMTLSVVNLHCQQERQPRRLQPMFNYVLLHLKESVKAVTK